MAKKKVTIKSERREIFNLEVAIIVLVGIIVILGTGFAGLLLERNAMFEEAYQAKVESDMQGNDLIKAQMKLKEIQSTESAMKGQLNK